jgi:hypothetical protein
MRWQLMLIPPALVAPAVAQASAYVTVEEAQKALFPGASFTPADLVLDQAQVEELLRVARSPVLRSRVKAWRVSDGGWFILDQVFGRDDRITYAIGLDASGAVKGLEILVCESGYDGVRSSRWLAQFDGVTQSGADSLGERIANISGTTLSVNHITEGVRRVLATHALFLARR